MIGHVAHPAFDVEATHRFYTDVLGATLKLARSGDSSTWNGRYVMAVYDVCGVEVDFFSYAGIARPHPDGLPRDIRHVGITLDSSDAVAAMRGRVERANAEHWIEYHDGPNDEHVYVVDPNGLVLEFSLPDAPWTPRDDADGVLRAWIDATSRAAR